MDLAFRDRTALHVAACSNYVECVKVLLEYHATVNIQVCLCVYACVSMCVCVKMCVQICLEHSSSV